QSDSTSHHETDSSAYDAVGTTVYDPGLLMVAVGLESGKTWSVESDVLVTTDLWGDSEDHFTGAYMVENEDELETEGGTLTTYEINGAGDMDSGQWTAHDYRDADIGLVSEDDMTMLVAWSG